MLDDNNVEICFGPTSVLNEFAKLIGAIAKPTRIFIDSDYTVTGYYVSCTLHTLKEFHILVHQ